MSIRVATKIESAQGADSAVEKRELADSARLAEIGLVERAIAGDERALREIYRTHQRQVRAHLYRLLGDDSEVDDLLQTVFARAFNALDRFEGKSSLRTWLYRITANTTHNLLRKRYRTERIRSAFGRFVNAAGPRVESSRVEARDEAARALRNIAPELQEVFILYHYEGLTLQEISDVLERPISTIGDRLTRARKRLKVQVQQ
jgi:RNA polymerase sigma-70 factor (ECF subfamily)